jgi:hypothetical protein
MLNFPVRETLFWDDKMIQGVMDLAVQRFEERAKGTGK